jgi:hypothetical protein
MLYTLLLKMKTSATAQEYYSLLIPFTNMPHISIDVEILSNLKDNNNYNQFLKLSTIENGPNCQKLGLRLWLCISRIAIAMYKLKEDFVNMFILRKNLS